MTLSVEIGGWTQHHPFEGRQVWLFAGRGCAITEELGGIGKALQGASTVKRSAISTRQRSDCGRRSPSAELRVALGATRKEWKQEFAGGLSSQYLGEHWRGLVVTHHQGVTCLGIKSDPSVTQVTVHNPRLVFLVVIDPKFHSRLDHRHPCSSQRSGSNPGLSTGAEKHDRSDANRSWYQATRRSSGQDW